MASSTESVGPRAHSLAPSAEFVAGSCNLGETRLLLEAFETFTQASNSLESAFQQLQEHSRRLSEELEAKNRELENTLQEKEEAQNYLKQILESLPCGVVVLDANGNITLCNPVAAGLLHQRQKKSAKPHRAGRLFSNASLRDYFKARVAPECRKKEIEIPFFAGGKMRVLAASGSPLEDAAGTPIGALHIIRDITEMKLLQEQSKRGERLSAMGEMAVELAHEIRNPLGSIELFASLLEKELSPDGDLGRWAANIRIGSRSLNNIVSNMLHFANPLSPSFAEVDVHDVIREILCFLEPIMRQREVSIVKHLAADEPIVYGDRELLKQMMLNLVMNSMQAMPSRGTLAVGTRDVAQLPAGAPCTGLEFSIQDSGVGIPPENVARVFDPFFTTNRNGTGLGLSVVHQIVDKHSGFIRVESKENVGTTFTIILPNARLDCGAA